MSIMPYEDFRENETIKYGTAATSASANHAPLVIKAELNELYNYVKMKFSEDPFEWDSRLTYKIGDVAIHNGVVYVATADNGNQEPPSGAWEVFDLSTLDMDLKYIQIASPYYVKLAERNGSFMMSSNLDSTNALMTPKNGLVAWDDGTSSDLGATTKRYRNVYSVNGNFSAVSSGTINATTITGSTMNATNFIGLASSAKYADIAEMYLPDEHYAPGTVLAIGGKFEVTKYKDGMKVAGVVSTQPGYMLNSQLEGGTFIALKGRVPCFVNSEVKKGQYVIADDNGAAKGVDDYTFKDSKKILGIALSDSVDNIVEIKI